MKKFFSLIALVGVFAACQPEGLTTAFEVGDAEATISVKVVDILTGEDITSSATVTTPLTVPVESDGSIKDQDYPVTATYKSGTGTASVHINALRPGGKAHYSVVIPLGGDITDYTISLKAGTPEETSVLYYLAASKTHGHAYSYKGYETWLENASAFVLVDSASYEEYAGSELVGTYVVKEPAFEEYVKNAAAAYDGTITSTTKLYDFKVSAWSLYNVFGTVTTSITPWQVIATPTGSARIVGSPDGVVGTFDVKTMSSAAEKEECAHPAHASLYIEGHGTSEIAGGNAGGGIVVAE